MFLPHLNAGNAPATAPAPAPVDFVPGFDDIETAPPVDVMPDREPARNVVLPWFDDIARAPDGTIGTVRRQTENGSGIIELIDNAGNASFHVWNDCERLNAPPVPAPAPAPVEPEPVRDDWRTVPGRRVSSYNGNTYEFTLSNGTRRLVTVKRSEGMQHARDFLRSCWEPCKTEPIVYVPQPVPVDVDEIEPEPEPDETETDNATLPEFWQRETELQAFARELDANGTAGYFGNVWTIRPNGNAFEFTRTQPDGTTSTVVCGRYGFTFESYARTVSYIVQNARNEFVIEPEETASGCKIETRYHKRRGTNVFCVIMPEPLGTRFSSEKQRAKRSGGWYAREFKPEHVSGGFMFLKSGDARTFANGFKPSTVRNNSPEETRAGVQHGKPAPAEPAQRPRRAISEPEKRAELFRELAEKLEKHIAHDSRPMTQNPTRKRLEEYDSRMHRARNHENTRDALRALAYCLETDGTFPAWLQALKTTGDVAELVSVRWRAHGEYHNATATALAVQTIMEQWRANNRNAGYTTSVDIEYARNRLETPFRYLSANYATGFNETETDSRSAGWTFDEPDVFDGDF